MNYYFKGMYKTGRRKKKKHWEDRYFTAEETEAQRIKAGGFLSGVFDKEGAGQRRQVARAKAVSIT